jgi:molybdopterin-guanine dinucleotide biosynthesis protein A
MGMALVVHGLVLAGGQGRRMGGADKALLPLGPGTLLDQALARLGPQVAALAVSANGDPARLARFGLPVLADKVPMGPLSGLLAGLRWAAARGATHLATVPVDAPFLPGDLVPRLLLAGDGGPAIARAGGRLHPVCALWPVTLAPALAAFLDSGAKPKVMDFASAQGAAIADFPDDGAFANVNTPEDLVAAGAHLSS